MIEGQDEFFNVTKAIHNGLQGDPADITEDGKRVFREGNKRNAEALEGEFDYVIVHDPQPAGIAELKRSDGALDLALPYRPLGAQPGDPRFLPSDALRVRRDCVPPARVRAA